jgi:branched-chain amino acid transport system substrate-binding protein
MNQAGVRKALRDSYSPKAYGAARNLVGRLKSAKIGLIFFGGYPSAAADLIREVHDDGVALQIVSIHTLGGTEIAKTGAAADGAMFIADADSRDYPSARDVVAEFQKAGVEPESYVLNTYAAVQLWAAAVAKAGTTDADKLAQVLRAGSWNTILGPVSFDAKGDATKPNTTWYVYKSGTFTQLKP